MAAKSVLMDSVPGEKFHLAAWVAVIISIGFLIVFLLVLLFCYAFKLFKKKNGKLPATHTPNVYVEIKEISVDQNSSNHVDHTDYIFDVPENCSEKNVKIEERKNHVNAQSQSGSSNDVPSVENNMITSISPCSGLPESSHLGWGHWFTLRALEVATDNFSKENVIGEGGYGVVYRGRLINGALVAVKRILNNLGQGEKEFRAEVEAIGHVRHKHLVRLLGFCVEGAHRLLVYEYVNNGNLQQWLHGAMSPRHLSWEGRMKILLGAAKALAYLHDAIEPKVVHRDIKSSNILIDDDFNAKISDFGVAKLLGGGKSHVVTRVMGTFGYIAPEYASSGLLNEKSDVYSFGVVMLEAITGREPVDDSFAIDEKKVVDWVKMMVLRKRSEEVVDPNMEIRPSIGTIKRALLIALRCLDSNLEKRPSMIQVLHMLESK